MSRETKPAAPSLYILDTCAYFRLARSVRPLLGRAFGKPPHYKIFVIKRLVTEHLGSPRLRSKFHWISENEIQNEIASGTYMPKGRKKSTVDEAMSFLRNYVDDVYVAEAKPGPSPADLEALAVAFAIPGFVVSDDKNLRLIIRGGIGSRPPHPGTALSFNPTASRTFITVANSGFPSRDKVLARDFILDSTS